MKRLLARAGSVEGEQASEWIEEISSKVLELEPQERDCYYLLIADVSAGRLRDVPQALRYLNKVKSKREVIRCQQSLRKSHYHYLMGDYQQANSELEMIQLLGNDNPHLASITQQFFNRIVRAPEESILGEDQRQAYEAEYLKALQSEHKVKIADAVRKHKNIIKNFSKVHPAVAYESAKHILRLSKQGPSRVQGIEEYRQIVNREERNFDNPDYYEQKCQYLLKVIEITQEEVESSNVDMTAVKRHVLQSIEAGIESSSDRQTKNKLIELKKKLAVNDDETSQLCYRFLGEKVCKAIGAKAQKLKGSPARQNNLRKPAQPMFHETFSNMKAEESETDPNFDPDFTGSMMTKINFNSSGHESRYFYTKDDFKRTFRLFYCAKQDKTSKDDDFYRLKGFKKLQIGKVSKVFERQECDDFEEELCFTLKISGQDETERNFYVEDPAIYKKWIALFNTLIKKKKGSSQQSNVLKTNIFV